MARRGFNHIGDYIRSLGSKKTRAMVKVGRFCVSKMDYYVAVDTGYLKSRNDYKIAGKAIRLINDCAYAGFQEFGTSKMRAHPFIRPSVYNHVEEIKSIVRSVYR